MNAYYLIATKRHKYFSAAWNLACSLRYHGSKSDIILLCDPAIKPHERLTGKPGGVFTRIEFLKGDDLIPFYNKTRLYKLADPKYKKVIYLDVDSLAIKPTDHLFEQKKPVVFNTYKQGNRSNHGINMAWANVDKLYDHYGIPDKNIFSEVNSI